MSDPKIVKCLKCGCLRADRWMKEVGYLAGCNDAVGECKECPKLREVKYITAVPDEVTGIIAHRGMVFVSTKKQVFKLLGDCLVPIKFACE